MYPLNEMARPRTKVLDDLSSYGSMLFEHLVKVFYHFDSEENIKGWCVSLSKPFVNIPLVRIGKKVRKITKEEIFSEFWIHRWDEGKTIDSSHRVLVSNMNALYDDLPEVKEIKYDEFRSFMEMFLRLAAQKTEELDSLGWEDVLEIIIKCFEGLKL